MITPTRDASLISSVLNHPSIRPDIADLAEGYIDGKEILSKKNVLALSGEYGIFILFKLFEGCYENHTAVLPEGRGEWARHFAEAGAHYMFTVTDCVEILTRVPEGHVAADKLTQAMGFKKQFTTPPECLFRGKKVPCHIWGLTIQDWSVRATWEAKKGEDFHAWLNSRITKHGEPHAPDPDHNRIVGITLDMMAAGQAKKAVIWYSRWAFSARHPPIVLLSEDPPQVRFDAGILTLQNGQIRLDTSH